MIRGIVRDDDDADVHQSGKLQTEWRNEKQKLGWCGITGHICILLTVPIPGKAKLDEPEYSRPTILPADV